MAQLLVNAVALGAAYALVALGFVLTLNAAGAVNFAQGDLVMAGGLLAAVLTGWLGAGVPGVVLLPAVLAAMAGFGLLAALAVYWPLRRRPPETVFLSTIALGIILQNGALLAAGPAPQAAPALLDGGTLAVCGILVARQSLAIIVVAAGLILAVALLLYRTRLGRMMRATAQDPDMARACGIRVPWVVLGTFALAAALSGAAGLLLANQYFVSPTEGGELILKAYIAVTIGGWGSLPGAVLGALLIALFETVVAAFLSYPVAAALLYGALLAILAVRPQGLFGEAVRRRA